MSDDRQLERAARSWLEAGPDRAPDHAVEAALLRIQTTTQKRDWHVPRRDRPMTLTARLLAGAIAIAIVTVGGILVLRPGGSNVANPKPSPTLQTRVPSAVAGVSPTPVSSAGAIDYSTIPGRILMEHLGNAPDGSEPSSDYHTDRRRFYWMDPKTMAGKTAVEFIPGQPAAGKLVGDISPDQKKIVFQDSGNGSGEFLWIANLDGTGLTKIATSCNAARAACGDWDPAFDPTGTKVAFVRAQADTAIIEIKDLVSGTETRLLSTEGSSANDVAEQPSWSPDGTTIAFGRVHWKSEGVPTSGTISVVAVATDKTTVLPIAVAFPGDPHWSPDGSRILLMNGPLSLAGVAFDNRPNSGDIYTVAADGSDLRQLTHGSQKVAAEYTPDGQHVIFFSNNFWMMKPDGSDPRPVNARGDDLSELNVGFGYVGHWVDTP